MYFCWHLEIGKYLSVKLCPFLASGELCCDSNGMLPPTKCFCSEFTEIEMIKTYSSNECVRGTFLLQGC